MKVFKKLMCALLVLAVLFSFAACSVAPSDLGEGIKGDIPASDPGYGESSKPGFDTQSALLQNNSRKIIYSFDCIAYTQDLDKSVQTLLTVLARYPGSYIEGSSKYNNYSYESVVYRLRIKSEDFDAFVKDLKEVGEINNEVLTSYDVSADYFDLEAQKAAKEAEQARLLELYDTATSVADLTVISQRMAQVQAELNSIYSRLNNYDALVALSSVTISIYETAAPAPNPNFWTRLKDAFTGAGKAILVFFEKALFVLIYAVPFVIIFGAIGLGVFFIVKKHRKKKKTYDYTSPDKKD